MAGHILGILRKPSRETMLEIFHRNPKRWVQYRDEANLLIYGSADPARIRLAEKEHRRRQKRRP